ncbi:MAG: hypothetical protein ACRC78_03090 [Planktothrix sp.]
MKYLAYLPEFRNYTQIHSNRPDQFWYVDRATIALRVRSPIPDPFDRLWVISFCDRKQKADNSEYPIKLDLVLYMPSGSDLANLPKAAIARHVVKGSHVFLPHGGYVIPLRGDGVPRSLVYEINL